MCLAVPGKVIALNKEKKTAVIDQAGKKTEASTALIKPKIGDYVLIQAKTVVEVLTKEEARHLLGE
jgi:hydrogenase assembly chaperone HypC/HupF